MNVFVVILDHEGVKAAKEVLSVTRDMSGLCTR